MNLHRVWACFVRNSWSEQPSAACMNVGHLRCGWHLMTLAEIKE